MTNNRKGKLEAEVEVEGEEVNRIVVFTRTDTGSRLAPDCGAA